MRFQNSLFTLIASLCVVLMFVICINLATSNPVSAVITSPPQVDEGNFDPVADQDEETQEEDWDEEEREIDEDSDADGEGEDEWDEEEEWDEEGEREELELHVMQLEIDRMETELNIGRLDLISRMKELAENDTSMAAFAIMHASEFLEGEEAINVFESLLEEDTSPSVKNLIKMKLAEFYAHEDRQDDVAKMLKSMILSK